MQIKNASLEGGDRMISKEELWALKDERKILIASKDEAKSEFRVAKAALNRSNDKKEYLKLLQEVRIKGEILSWYEYQVDEVSGKISQNYREVWRSPKPKPEAGKSGKKKPRRGRRKN